MFHYLPLYLVAVLVLGENSFLYLFDKFFEKGIHLHIYANQIWSIYMLYITL